MASKARTPKRKHNTRSSKRSKITAQNKSQVVSLLPETPSGIQTISFCTTDPLFRVTCSDLPKLLNYMWQYSQPITPEDLLDIDLALFNMDIPVSHAHASLPDGPMSLFLILYGITNQVDYQSLSTLDETQQNQFQTWCSSLSQRSETLNSTWDEILQARCPELTTELIHHTIQALPELSLHQVYTDKTSSSRVALLSPTDFRPLSSLKNILSRGELIWLYGNKCVPVEIPNNTDVFGDVLQQICEDLNSLLFSYGIETTDSIATIKIPAAGDGDCLFHSVITALQLSTSVLELRTAVSNAILLSEDFKGTLDLLPKHAARKIKTPGYYNSDHGDLIVEAIAKTLEINIDIFQPNRVPFRITNHTYQGKIGLLLQGGHYDSLQLTVAQLEINHEASPHHLQRLHHALSLSESSTPSTNAISNSPTQPPPSLPKEKPPTYPLQAVIQDIKRTFTTDMILINGIPTLKTPEQQLELIAQALHQWELHPLVPLSSELLSPSKLRFLNPLTNQCSVLIQLAAMHNHGRLFDSLLNKLPTTMTFTYEDRLYPTTKYNRMVKRHLFGQLIDQSLTSLSELGSLLVCRGISHHGSVAQAQSYALENYLSTHISSPYVLFFRIHELSHWFQSSYQKTDQDILPNECVISVEILSTNGYPRESDREDINKIRDHLQLSTSTPRSLWFQGIFLQLHMGYSFFPSTRSSLCIPDGSHFMLFDSIDPLISSTTILYNISSSVVLPNSHILNVILIDNSSRFFSKVNTLHNQLIIIWDEYRFLSEPELKPILALTKPIRNRARKIQDVLYGLPYIANRPTTPTTSTVTTITNNKYSQAVTNSLSHSSRQTNASLEQRISLLEQNITQISNSLQQLLKLLQPSGQMTRISHSTPSYSIKYV